MTGGDLLLIPKGGRAGPVGVLEGDCEHSWDRVTSSTSSTLLTPVEDDTGMKVKQIPP